MNAVQETQFSDDEMMDDDDHLVAEQSPHEHPVLPNNTDIVFVVAHKQHPPMADTALHSAAGAAASQRRPPLGATTTSPQHPLAVTTDLLTDSSFPQTRRLSSSQRVRSGNSLLYGNGVGGGSGSFTPQSNPNVALGPHHHIKQVSVTHDDYLHTNVKPTAYHSAFCGCGLGCQSSERSPSPNGGGGKTQQQHNGSTTMQVSRFEKNEYEENCCCFLSHRTDSRWWQGCCETLFCFPCVVASQRKFLLYGPPNPVASPLSPPPSAVPAHVRARLNASALAASQVAAASSGAAPPPPPLPAETLVKQTSGSSFDNGASLQDQEYTQPCFSRCCYSDCILATLVPCVAVGFAVENRYLMAKYHMISDDNNNNTAIATTATLLVAEGVVPDSTTARSPRVPSRNGSLISAATPTPQLRVYQSRPPPTSATNCCSWSSCLFPCCSVAQVGRELEMRGVGDQVRLRAPVTATMGFCCTETHHDDDSPLKNTSSSSAQATPPPTIVTTTTTTSSRGNQLPATTAAAPLPTSGTGSPSTTNGASPGYVQQKNNTVGATNVPNYHLTTDNNNNSLSQSFRPSGGGAQAATTVANGKGEDFIWVPFYPEVATKEMMQRMSRDFWRHAPPPSHTSMNFSRNNNDLMINSIRAGSPPHNASGAARRNVMAPTARLPSGDAFLPPPSRTPTGLGETTIPPVASPTDIRNNPLVVRRPSRQLEVEEDDVDEELSQHVFPERGGGGGGGVSGLVDPRAGFYPQNHIAMLLGA